MAVHFSPPGLCKILLQRMWYLVPLGRSRSLKLCARTEKEKNMSLYCDMEVMVTPKAEVPTAELTELEEGKQKET